MRILNACASAGGWWNAKGQCVSSSARLPFLQKLPSWGTLLLLCFLCIAGFLPCQAKAQILYGSITGNVTDTTGAVVQGAVVTATNVGTNTSTQVTTNKSGGYLVENLQPGTYEVVISAPSFTSAQLPGIVLTPNTLHRVDVRLQAGASNSTVSVTASGSALQTDSATVNTVLSGRDITNLPTGAQRNYQTLNEILPGSSPNVNQHPGAANPQDALTNHVNGLSFTNNVTLIDGASDIYPFLPETPAYIPPAESIDSVTIVTNSFTGDEGMAGGYLTNLITRSGTNSFHGGAWEYNTDSAFQARPYFFVGRVPKNIINQFGLAVGGPILRNSSSFSSIGNVQPSVKMRPAISPFRPTLFVPAISPAQMSPSITRRPATRPERGVFRSKAT